MHDRSSCRVVRRASTRPYSLWPETARAALSIPVGRCVSTTNDRQMYAIVFAIFLQCFLCTPHPARCGPAARGAAAPRCRLRPRWRPSPDRHLGNGPRVEQPRLLALPNQSGGMRCGQRASIGPVLPSRHRHATPLVPWAELRRVRLGVEPTAYQPPGALRPDRVTPVGVVS